jgi:hypothetical protein
MKNNSGVEEFTQAFNHMLTLNWIRPGSDPKSDQIAHLNKQIFIPE